MVEETQAFKSVAAKLNPIPYPKCERFRFRSDEYWACYQNTSPTRFIIIVVRAEWEPLSMIDYR